MEGVQAEVRRDFWRMWVAKATVLQRVWRPTWWTRSPRSTFFAHMSHTFAYTNMQHGWGGRFEERSVYLLEIPYMNGEKNESIWSSANSTSVQDKWRTPGESCTQSLADGRSLDADDGEVFFWGGKDCLLMLNNKWSCAVLLFLSSRKKEEEAAAALRRCRPQPFFWTSCR